MHRKVDATATKWEPKFAGAAAKALRHDKRELVERMEGTKAEVEWTVIGRKWDEYFERFAGEEWREEFMPLIEGLVAEQGESWNTTLGMQFDVRNYLAEAWLDDYMLVFAQDINNTTKQDVSKMLQQAMREGWGIDEMSTQLSATWERYLMVGYDGQELTDEERKWFEERSPRYRRDMIARTETMRASNAGSQALFRGMGAQKKEWWATGDDRTRDSHLVAWQRYSEGGSPGPILMDQPFEVGGARLMQPGDPSGPPEETIQCRCTVLPFMDAWAGTEEEIAAARAGMEAEVARREAVSAAEAAVNTGAQARQQLKEQAEPLAREFDALDELYRQLMRELKEESVLLRQMEKEGVTGFLYADQERRYKEVSQQFNLAYADRLKMRKRVRQAALDVLRVDNPAQFEADIKKRGIKPDRLKKWEGGINEFRALVGTGTLDGKTVTVQTAGKSSRSYYRGEAVYIASWGSEGHVIHELGHWLEHSDPAILQKAVEFHKQRTEGESARWLGDDYDIREVTKRDKYPDSYMGKTYGPEDNIFATEIVSMGMEHMWKNPVNFAKKDTEYFDFIYDLLRGQ